MSQLRVWRLDELKDCKDADERDDLAWKVPDTRGVLYPENSAPVTDVRQGAKLYAEYCNARRDAWEWNWPIDFVVHDGTGYFVVEVDRHIVPEFEAHKPKPMESP